MATTSWVPHADVTVRNLLRTEVLAKGDVVDVVLGTGYADAGLSFVLRSGARVKATALTPVKGWGRPGYPDDDELAELERLRARILQLVR